MVLMTAAGHTAALTRADLDALPDDGRRHELIDGALVVTPAPGNMHQSAVVELILLLGRECPEDARVRTAPFDVTLAEDTVVQPDVLVARQPDLTDAGLPAAPLLAVEVLSPSTRLIDLRLKRACYEAAGVASYWVVDPAAVSVTVWELRAGAYREVAHAAGEEPLAVERPFPLTVVPERLFR
jgi:Uma2 family endonuclease